MNLSYNWLKEYINIEENVEILSKELTSLGLEVGTVENFSSIKGGLKSFVIGKVLTCEKHPNADKLHVTTVDVGNENPLNIVCGAPNVAAGQKVVVATIGATIYMDDNSFEIKKSKIRGIESEGMICAEDELGLGKSHAGILVLDDDAVVGSPAASYFNIENDTVLEIDLTANRIDAASHIGVARDLAALKNIKYNYPKLSSLKKGQKELPISIKIENADACKRYMGICMTDIKICESPQWLKNRLLAIGLTPINNIVDITNFVLHETGQPLHAFDYDKILGHEIIVKNVEEGTKFITLDDKERTLSSKDLMICNAQNPMCIAGVFGGKDSGVSENTKSIFIESAYFHPTSVRKTAKYHGISTDSSFRFERGADINILEYALLRAASLIQDLNFGTVASEAIDVYPQIIPLRKIPFNINKSNALIGKNIEKARLKEIIKLLEINILEENNDDLLLEIPSYRVDVTHYVDVVEDILRIYGYNNVENPAKIEFNVNHHVASKFPELSNKIANLLASIGFNEIICNSLISSKFFSEDDTNIVKLCNPLSSDLSVLRPSLIYGGLQTVAYNIKRKNHDLKLFELGKNYFYNSKKEISDITAYKENNVLSLIISGKKNPLSWNNKDKNFDFFSLKSYIYAIFTKLGVDERKITVNSLSDKKYQYGQLLSCGEKEIAKFGLVDKKFAEYFEIQQEVFFAEINFDELLKLIKNEKKKILISKFPKVRRDLALLIDKNISYSQLVDTALKTENKYITEINLFDVYEGKNIEEGKISYAISFILEDYEKTMTDKQIEKIMQKIIDAFKKEYNAQLR